MSEKNACVFCMHEQGDLPNGESGPWCRHFNEPIKFDRRDTDHYSGMNKYSHSGRANGHQSHCPGFQLNPQNRATWESYGFDEARQPVPPRTPAASGIIGGLAGFVVKSIIAIVIPIVLAFVFGVLFGGHSADLAAGFGTSLIVCIVIALKWKSLGAARLFLVGVPLLFTILAIN
jgi:hypothetical protein